MLTTITAPASVIGVTAVTSPAWNPADTHKGAPAPTMTAFFLRSSIMAGRVGRALSFLCGCSGPVPPRRVSPPKSRGTDDGGSSHKGASPMAIPRLLPTRDPSARAAAHRAMARAALFSDSSAATRLKRYNHHMSKARSLEEHAELHTFSVYVARSGARMDVRAATWQDALRSTGRDDACLLELRTDLLADAGTVIVATFDPEATRVIDARCREATTAELKAWALALVVNCLDRESAGRRVAGGES